MKTASQVRYEKAVQEMAKERFWKHPETLPEAIAKHYCAHAMIALELAQLIKLRRSQWRHDPEVNKLIEHMAEQIKTNHVHDFGTELIDTVSDKARAWQRYIDEIDGVE